MEGLQYSVWMHDPVYGHAMDEWVCVAKTTTERAARLIARDEASLFSRRSFVIYKRINITNHKVVGRIDGKATKAA